jgi:prepilin-type N-terminal cleavage/methylation domain-containing protein
VKNLARRRALDAQRGMTLIEILVVLVILGLIATAVAVNVVGRAGQARVDRAKTDVQRIASDGSRPTRSCAAAIRPPRRG